MAWVGEKVLLSGGENTLDEWKRVCKGWGMANEKEVSDELLAEAVDVANEVLDVEPDDDDLAFARQAMQLDDPEEASPRAMLIIGYVEVARRGGRS